MSKQNEPQMLLVHQMIQAELCRLYRRSMADISHHQGLVFEHQKILDSQSTRGVRHYRILIRCFVCNDRSLGFESKARLPGAAVGSNRGGRSRSERLTGKSLNLRNIGKRATEWELPFVEDLVHQFRRDHIPRYERLVGIRRSLEILLRQDGIAFDPLLHLTTPETSSDDSSESNAPETFDDYDLGYCNPSSRVHT